MISIFFQYLIPFIVLLSILVFIHELGHFLVARYYGVTVEVFSIGFGPKILKYKKGKTLYCVSAIPLGGYVKMFGDNPRQLPTGKDRKRAFLCQKVWPKMAIALGGPLMNFFLAILIFMAIGFIGHKQVTPFLGDIKPDSKAYSLGFRSGDKVLSIDNKKITYWNDVTKVISNSSLKTLPIVVERDGLKKQIDTPIGKKTHDHITSLQKHIGYVEGLTFLSRSAHIGIKNKNSLAYKNGLRTFDNVKELNGVMISNLRELKEQFSLFKRSFTKSQLLSIKVQRDDKILPLTIPVHKKSSLKGLGIEETSLFVDRVKQNSPAQEAGILSKDYLFSLNGKKLYSWNSFSSLVQNKKSSPLKLVVIRDGEKKSLSITPRSMSVFNSDGKIQYKQMIGVASAQYMANPPLQPYRILNPIKALIFGVKETLRWVAITGKVLYKLMTGSVSRRMLGGPLSIAKAAKQSFYNSLIQFLKVMAIISVNLFIMNLLPIPVLDGGHLLMFVIEGIQGRPLSVNMIEKLQMFGFGLLLFFITMTIFNDIQNWNLVW